MRAFSEAGGQSVLLWLVGFSVRGWGGGLDANDMGVSDLAASFLFFPKSSARVFFFVIVMRRVIMV